MVKVMNTIGRSNSVESVKIIEADNNKTFCQRLQTAFDEGYTLAEGGPQVTSFLGIFTSWQAVVIRFKRTDYDILTEDQ